MAALSLVECQPLGGDIVASPDFVKKKDGLSQIRLFSREVLSFPSSGGLPVGAREGGMLFPTAGKAKIGKDFSWPVGAEVISSTLADVPQAALIQIEFHSPEQHYSPETRPPIVMGARYYFKANSVFFARRPEVPRPSTPTWTVEVWANYRSFKGRIRKLLVEQGLSDVIKPWLVQNDGEPGREGEALVRLYFDPVNDVLLSRGVISLTQQNQTGGNAPRQAVEVTPEMIRSGVARLEVLLEAGVGLSYVVEQVFASMRECEPSFAHTKDHSA